jgi:uncharacterized membrane protein
MKTNEPYVAVFETHADAENAIRVLQKAKFEMKHLSIVGRDYDEEEKVVGYYNAGERMKYWGKAGAFWGGIWGLLFGSAFFWVPGVGQILVAGPLVVALVAVLEGAVAVGGLNVLGAGLYSLGIPKDSILQYETALKARKFVLVAHGTPAEISRARQVLCESNNRAALEPAAAPR